MLSYDAGKIPQKVLTGWQRMAGQMGDCGRDVVRTARDEGYGTVRRSNAKCEMRVHLSS